MLKNQVLIPFFVCSLCTHMIFIEISINSLTDKVLGLALVDVRGQSGDHQSQGAMNVCAKFNSNPIVSINRLTFPSIEPC